MTKLPILAAYKLPSHMTNQPRDHVTFEKHYTPNSKDFRVVA